MEDDIDNPILKKQRKKKQKQFLYKHVFDNTPFPEKKITIIPNKKKDY
jgi:hypothetical protein